MLLVNWRYISLYSSLVDMEVVSVFAFVSWKSDVFRCERGCGVKFPCSSQPEKKFSIRSMWKPVVLVPFQSSIFLVSMFQSRLFAWDLYDMFLLKTRQRAFYFEMDISCRSRPLFVKVKEIFARTSEEWILTPLHPLLANFTLKWNFLFAF